MVLEQSVLKASKRDGHEDVTKFATVPNPRKATCLGGKAH
jgi:hypothetical protein